MDHAGLVCARRRSVRQHDGLQARAAGGSRVGRRFNLSSKPTSLLAVAAAAAATIVTSSSGVHARDSFTVSAGYQHTCIVTADADVKVSLPSLSRVRFLPLSLLSLSLSFSPARRLAPPIAVNFPNNFEI